MNAVRTEKIAEKRFAANAESVFGCLVDIGSYSAWLPQEVQVRLLTPTVGVGTRFQLTSHGESDVLELLLFEPPTSLTYAYIDEPESGVETWTLTPEADGGCTLTVSLALEDHDPDKRLLGFLTEALDTHRERVAKVLTGLARLLGEG